ncbi:MAG TPA: lytic murein transglycosylase [Nocardioidaceae bacterium]|nr:lytic murein transglycosylase [Nocardioidaceae bacterium]
MAAVPLVLNTASLPLQGDQQPSRPAARPPLVIAPVADAAISATPPGTSTDPQPTDLPGQSGTPGAVTVAAPKGDRTVTESGLGSYDIPLAALTAYKRAASIMADVAPSCGVPWTLLAGIGRVESNHGRYGGATLGTDGVSDPLIIGVALDGAGPVAEIHDTDAGLYDQDTVWDRAVGPMQFLPSTWSAAGVDADGDGVQSPNDIDDATLAAAVYLCAGGGDLTDPTQMRTALLRYNNSSAYAALVMGYEASYRTGDFSVSEATTPVAPGTVVTVIDDGVLDRTDRAAKHAAKHGHGRTDGISEPGKKGKEGKKDREKGSRNDGKPDSWPSGPADEPSTGPWTPPPTQHEPGREPSPDPKGPKSPGTPGPDRPTPTDPTPTDPGPSDPGPTGPTPTDPGPTVPSPTDPSPGDPGPTDPSPSDPSPTETGDGSPSPDSDPSTSGTPTPPPDRPTGIWSSCDAGYCLNGEPLLLDDELTARAAAGAFEDYEGREVKLRVEPIGDGVVVHAVEPL